MSDEPVPVPENTDEYSPAEQNVEPEPPALDYASNAPGEMGTPRPRRRSPMPIVLSLALGGGVAWFALPSFQRCHGATRSARLRWEQRQSEIEQAIRSERPLAEGTQP